MAAVDDAALRTALSVVDMLIDETFVISRPVVITRTMTIKDCCFVLTSDWAGEAVLVYRADNVLVDNCRFTGLVMTDSPPATLVNTLGTNNFLCNSEFAITWERPAAVAPPRPAESDEPLAERIWLE